MNVISARTPGLDDMLKAHTGRFVDKVFDFEAGAGRARRALEGG